MAKHSSKGKFLINFPKTVAGFENAMHKFPVKKILYKNIFRGKGLEFDSYRVFQPDDDASLIDWKASLRSNQILAKKYVEERELNVYFLLDVSGSMLFGSEDKLKAEYAAEVVASLGHLVLGAGDKVGMIMFGDGISKVLRPACAKSQFALLTKFLSDSSFYGGSSNLNGAIDYVLQTVKSPYTVFILVSDFLHIRKSNLDKLRLMGTKFESVAIMIRDRLDEDLPYTDYQIAVQDPSSGRQMVLDPAIARRKYQENVLKQKTMAREMMGHSKIDLLELVTHKDFSIIVSNFLRSRATGVRI